jgi:hypothetical protein
MFDFLKRKTYKDGYKQALKDVWGIEKGTIRACFSDCDYKIHGNCTLSNDDYLKCPKVKKYLKGVK